MAEKPTQPEASSTDPIDAGLSGAETTLRNPVVPSSGPVQFEAAMRVGQGGRYEVVDKVGEGGMGSVWRVKDLSLDGRIVAMKRIRLFDEEDQHMMERFNQERRSIAELKHANVVTVLDAGTDDQGPYLVMEYVEGEPLNRVLKNGPLSEERAVAIFEGLCRGVAHAHKKGVIHRDIKPANVMLDGDGTPKLLDFGLARGGAGMGLSQEGQGMGTLDYTAPEQKRDAKAADERADIYSLGATFYELLTGLSPVPLHERKVPVRWQTLVVCSLEPDPADRYQSAAELLDAISEGRQAAAPEPVAPTRKTGDDLSCRSCGHRNRESARYCKECGECLFVECPGCSNEARQGPSHCEACGAAILAVREGKACLERALALLKEAQLEDAQREAGTGLEAIEGARLGPAKSLVKDLSGIHQFEFGDEPDPPLSEAELDDQLRQMSPVQLECLRAVAGAGLPYGQFLMAVCYQEGIGFEEEEDEALEWCTAAAEQGYADPQFRLGLRYAGGVGVPQNQAEALGWYRRAAEQGHADAQFHLGIHYAIDPVQSSPVVVDPWDSNRPRAVEQDSDQAQGEAWMRKAADQGHGEAQIRLGDHLSEGLGVAQDKAEALKWYLLAADQGVEDAQERLEECHLDAECVPKDKAEAAEWCRKAAEQGFGAAQFNMGLCHYHGWGVPEDKGEAVQWYRKAAEQDDAYAQYNLGLWYASEMGLGDLEGGADMSDRYVDWYRSAAEGGFAAAQRCLGACYAIGDGVDQDAGEAVKWYRKAANQGDAPAQYALAHCLLWGRGVVRNKLEAVTWYRKAAALGNAAAENALGVCLLHGWGVSSDVGQGARLFESASEQGEPGGMLNLAACHDQGVGIVRNSLKRDRYIKRAAELGYVSTSIHRKDHIVSSPGHLGFLGISINTDFSSRTVFDEGGLEMLVLGAFFLVVLIFALAS